MSSHKVVNRFFSLLNQHITKAAPNLSKYNVVVIGSNTGGLFSKHFEKLDKGKHSVYLATESDHVHLNLLRPQAERNLIEPIELILNNKHIISNSAQTSEGKSVSKILYEKSKIVLENGQEIEYGALVLASGLKKNPLAIAGLEEALNDKQMRVFCQEYLPQDKEKLLEAISTYKGGDSFVYLPEFPFIGEAQTFNFILAAWVWYKAQLKGNLTNKRKLTIINANEGFSKYAPELDALIKEKLKRYHIDVLYNHQLISIDKNSSKILVKDKGQISKEFNFDYLYSHCPVGPNKILDNEKISLNQKQVLVDKETLQNKSFENVFAIGENAELPLQSSFFASVYQSHVASHNVLQYLNQQALNAKYNGYSRIFIPTCPSKNYIYESTYEKARIKNIPLFYIYKKYHQLPDTIKKIYEGKKHGTNHLTWPKWEATKN